MRIFTLGFGSGDGKSLRLGDLTVENDIVLGSIDILSDKQIQSRQQLRSRGRYVSLGVFQFAWLDDGRPRVFATWTLGNDQFPAIRLQSDDVLLRREIPHERFEIESRHRQYDYDTVRDGDRFYRDFHKRMLLIELPVTER